MIGQLVEAVVQQRAASLRRRTAGAVLEVVAFGLFGLATLFLVAGLYLRLAQELEAWLAAMLVAAVVALVAGLVMVLGHGLLRGRARRRDGASARDGGAREPDGPAAAEGRPAAAGHDAEETGETLVAAALAAGIALGRSMRR